MRRGKSSTPDLSWVCVDWSARPFTNAYRIQSSISIWRNRCATWLRFPRPVSPCDVTISFVVGGFDAVKTPIAHSDIDLSFKVREAGLRCVYTPYATLNHAGHVSIAVEEKKEEARRRDKASIFLLKRWAHYTTHDPYFTNNMRDWLHVDSPTPIRMLARDEPASLEAYPDLLFVSHDLSL